MLLQLGITARDNFQRQSSTWAAIQVPPFIIVPFNAGIKPKTIQEYLSLTKTDNVIHTTMEWDKRETTGIRPIQRLDTSFDYLIKRFVNNKFK